MMFMRRSSLPVAVTSASASRLGVDAGVGVPSGVSLGDDATRTHTGVGMEDSVGAMRAMCLKR